MGHPTRSDILSTARLSNDESAGVHYTNQVRFTRVGVRQLVVITLGPNEVEDVSSVAWTLVAVLLRRDGTQFQVNKDVQQDFLSVCANADFFCLKLLRSQDIRERVCERNVLDLKELETETLRPLETREIEQRSRKQSLRHRDRRGSPDAIRSVQLPIQLLNVIQGGPASPVRLFHLPIQILHSHQCIQRKQSALGFPLKTSAPPCSAKPLTFGIPPYRNRLFWLGWQSVRDESKRDLRTLMHWEACAGQIYQYPAAALTPKSVGNCTVCSNAVWIQGLSVRIEIPRLDGQHGYTQA